MRIARYVLTLFLMLPGFPQAAVMIMPDASDTPLVMSGWLGEAAGFTLALRLTAQPEPGAPPSASSISFHWLASDLKDADGTATVSRRQIAVIGPSVLPFGVPQDFEIIVTGLRTPGRYRGQLELLPAGAPRDEARIFELEVIARARPHLEPLASAALRLNLVNCQHRWSCALAAWLLPSSALMDSWRLQFDNPTAADAPLGRVTGVVLGEITHFPLTEQQIQFPSEPTVIAAGEVGAVPVTLKRAAMPPDHYTGTLYLPIDGGHTRVLIPVDLQVRSGPLGPLVAILIGILLGRLVKYMQERGGPQAGKLAAVNRFAWRLRQAPTSDRALLEPQLDVVRQQVYRQRLETVDAALTAIEQRLHTLDQLRACERELQAEPESVEQRTALRHIATARQRLGRGQDVGALLQTIEQTVDAVKQGLITKGLPPAGEPIADTTTQAASSPVPGAAPETESRWLRRVRELLFTLAGLSDELRAEMTLWVVRPLLYFALLFGLLAVGLNTLYVTQGPTFGATPFADYLGLILWGLSADVAGRTLSNLQGSPAASPPVTQGNNDE